MTTKSTLQALCRKSEKRAIDNMSLRTTAEKSYRDGADATWSGSSFQTWAAATGKARSLTVYNRVRRTISDDDDDDDEKTR